MNLKYRPDIDGLRAFAVLSVIIFHLNPHWLRGGFIGVDIFFVISGYLITKIIYIDILNKQFSFKVFYQRRINRILPVFFAVMFTTAFAAWYLLLPDDFMLFLKSLKSTTYFWENMFFAQNTGGYWDKSAETMPILHTWSLAVEEQFYILFPFLLLLLTGVKYQTRKKTAQLSRNSILVVLAFIALISFTLAQLSPQIVTLSGYNYYSLITGRAGELLIGSIIGILSAHKPTANSRQKSGIIIKNSLSIIGFLMMVTSIFFLSEKRLFPSFWAVIPTIGAALIIFFYDKETIIAKLLSNKVLVFIGTISYSLYLWHWPIIVLAKQYLSIDKFSTVIEYLTVIVLMISMSLLSFYLIERPCRKYKKNFKFSFIIYYLTPSIIILSAYQLENKTESLSKLRYGDRVEISKLQKQYLNPESNFCHNETGTCLFGDKSKKPQILMIGDSNAGHYSPYIDEAGKKYGFAVRIMTADGCWIIPDFKKYDVLTKKKSCVALNEVAINELENYKVIIYSQSFEYGIPELNGAFSDVFPSFMENIKKLKKEGKNIVILGQIPFLTTNEYNILNKEFLLNKINYPITISKKRIASDVNQYLKKNLDGIATTIVPLDYLSDDNKKLWPTYNGFIGYKDRGHLNEFVTRQWSQEVLPKQKEFWDEILSDINNQSNAGND